MNVRTLCLAILHRGESTGYEIRKLSTEGVYGYFVDASYGSIYPALNRLESDGMVVSREEIQVGKPARKVYSITDDGRHEFLEALTKPVQRDSFKSPFMLVALYAEFVKPDVLKNALDAQIEHLVGELAIIDTSEEKMECGSAGWVAGLGRACLGQSLDYLVNNRAALEAVAGTALPDESGDLQAAE